MKQIISLTFISFLIFSRIAAQDFVFSPINVMHGLSDNQVRYIIQLPDGRMVFKTSGNINIYDGARFRYIHRKISNNFPLKNYGGHYRIYQSGDSTLWIKDRHQLMCVDLRKESYITNLNQYFENAGFHSRVDDIFFDQKQQMWLLINNQLISKNHKSKISLAPQLGVLQDISSDGEHLFLFYNTGAIVCHDLKTAKNKYTINAYPASEQMHFNRTSLVVKAANGFYQLRNGNLGGFFFFDLLKLKWKKLLQTDYTLNTLFVDEKGLATISCSNGIWMIDCQSGRSKYLPSIEKVDGGKLNTEISTVFYDRQGGLWLGTVNQGLLYHHQERNMFNAIRRSAFEVKSNKDILVQAFSEDEEGNIYIKSRSEFYQYHPKFGNHAKLRLLQSFSLPANELQKLNIATSKYKNDQATQLTDHRGWIWTGTADGLKVLDNVTGKEKTFYTKDGLSNNFIQSIFQDHDRNIWITTSYGINKVQIDAKTKGVRFIKFDPNAGVLEGEYLKGSAYESEDSTLYFGGVNGFTILNRKHLQFSGLAFKPVFTSLILHGQWIEIGKYYDGRILLEKAAPYTHDIELSHHQNFLTFEFTALNYSNPAQTYYRYQLDGIDRQWRETFSHQENALYTEKGMLQVSYTNLPPGKYKLKVKASNDNLKWDTPVSILTFTIKAPWWKTPLAYMLYIFLFLVLVLAIIYLYLRSERKKAERTRREDILLLRIRNLIDQQNFIQEQNERTDTNMLSSGGEADPISPLSQLESSFLANAISLVKTNLDVPDYSVEQLSRDLNMDRTGLYRKLITLLDKSPSIFIRNIRLEKAAELLIQGQLNISQIADRVGFSSSSYLSKCFQDMYGCKPSEYADSIKNQHKS
ncbi:helix-turn-helix domain-containing protein [Pedobacter rhizosphaerae]|uniref:Two component regulator propeller n=1 Tax=Pedobacter rhizosphaerae TaxID=390241 RepID=A0A1H9VQF1_9SPHI|nr:helix-turn-helix domain-containing protein [Pedobacter rhizosphaerae]SES23812.1 Two component regulator propeller [Pedobacter rhizosphaerae]